jgi:sulfur carrier protein
VFVIFLNGDIHDEGAGECVSAILTLLGLSAEARGVAVAVDGEVVPRGDWNTFVLSDGARVEVLTAMQGG